ncbi:peptidoglycan-binding protein [Streptomyces sp. NPDC006372]|uniref:peptidoglycan-binding domain-containing protein n=1 Tax=Streptomyces sp. NPDC006372 TaxID=3155599 RepID=UPI00339F4625
MQLKTRFPLCAAAAALGAGLLVAPTTAADSSAVATARPAQMALTEATAARLPFCEYAIEQRSIDSERHVTRPGVRPGNFTCTLRQGDRAPGVTALQVGLIRCYGARISVDMSFGPATKRALRAAQRRAGITADGIFGPTSSYSLRWPEYHNDNGQFTGRCIRRN